jgi:nitroreductase
MELIDAITGRRSIRAYTEQKIDRKTIMKIIKAGQLAPSAGNLQGRDFIIVENPQIKTKLAMAAYGQSFIAKAPVVIIACANQQRSASRYGNRGYNLYSIQDTSAAVQNMLLTCYAMGLGSCWVGAFNEAHVREILAIPEGIRPIALIPIGYPDEKGMPTSRFEDENVHWEKFNR